MTAAPDAARLAALYGDAKLSSRCREPKPLDAFHAMPKDGKLYLQPACAACCRPVARESMRRLRARRRGIAT
jgi:hypothetical protein